MTWSSPHLLSVGYDLAHINQFSNLWDASALEHSLNVSNLDRTLIGREYLVEIRLRPSSSDYSLLTPTGAFNPGKYGDKGNTGTDGTDPIVLAARAYLSA